ncbi:MAG: hypothetical protein OEV78_08470 [Spirochaetia bacterium]|nr:hypothetical protein [Spirochaetia bacterium]
MKYKNSSLPHLKNKFHLFKLKSTIKIIISNLIFMLMLAQFSLIYAGEETRVTGVSSKITLIDHIDSNHENNIPAAGIGDEIIITVDHLDSFLKKYQNPDNPFTPNIILLLNNIAIKGLKPLSIDSTNGKIVFALSKEDGSQTAWASLLGKWKFKELYQTIPISVGVENESIPSDAKLRLIYIRGTAFIVWIITTLLILLFFIYLSIKTPILKFTDINSPYSLSKTQMFLWIFVILTSYLFIWFVIQDFNSLNKTALTLLGLSLTTGGAAIFIDSRKINGLSQLRAESESLQETIQDLKVKINLLKKSTGDQLVNMQKELNEKTMQKAILDHKIKAFPVSNNSKAETFIKDLLHDSDGWSLPRLQVFIWTIILIGIFVSNVYSQLSMPEFNESLLLLMGISQGTYLGFKLPEKT